jgi:hypothetical protein
MSREDFVWACFTGLGVWTFLYLIFKAGRYLWLISQ